MAKITKQEFENYSKQFKSIFTQIINLPDIKSSSEEEQEKNVNMMAFTLVKIKQGSISALYSSCQLAEKLLKQDYSAIKRRVKEHVIARGYYNPTSPLTLAEFRARRNKIGWKGFEELWKNKEQCNKLLLEMNEEDKNFIVENFSFFEKLEEIYPAPEEDKGMTEEKWKEIGFIMEDILKVLEETHKKLEQRERERERQPFSHYP